MENTQSKVRHIPIFVEGRDQPVVNKDHDETDSGASAQANVPPQNSSNSTSAFASAESSSGPHHQPFEHHNFGRPMNFADEMGFGQDIPMPHGSIFERAKDFPVRDFFNMRSGSPRRSESPSQPFSNHFNSGRNAAGPGHHQQQWQQPQNNQDRQVPVQREAKRSSTPQRQQPAPQTNAQQPEPKQQSPAPQVADQSVPAKTKAIEDSITKIQKIQAEVLDLMTSVEKFDGADRKQYMYLDEMLTQNLLKLDNIDAEGKENIKNARREAIKCINSLISLLEAKKEEAARVKESAAPTEATEQDQPTQNAVNGASKNSSYDNVNNVKQTPSNNSVNMTSESTKEPEMTPEASLEAKVQNAMQKQEEPQPQN